MIGFHNVSLGFGTQQVLADVSFRNQGITFTVPMTAKTPLARLELRLTYPGAIGPFVEAPGNLPKATRLQGTLDFSLVLALVLLFSGVLPWAFNRFVSWRGDSAWAMAGFLFGLLSQQ